MVCKAIIKELTMIQIHPIALFRLTVLGQLVCRERLERGELTHIIEELSVYRYNIPDSTQSYLGEKTIQQWYYQWKHGGIEALAPKPRCDIGRSKIPDALQKAIISLKKSNYKLSLDDIIEHFKNLGVDGAQSLPRSSVHRLLQHHNLSYIRKIKCVENSQSKACRLGEYRYEKWRSNSYVHEFWLRKLSQGKFQVDDLIADLSEAIPQEDVEKLHDCILNMSLRYRNRAVCVLSVCKGVPKIIISRHLLISKSTVARSIKSYELHGVNAIISDLSLNTLKYEKKEYIDKTFSILHSPPSSYGFNRTSWRLVDLKAAMDRDGMSIAKSGLEKIIHNAGYSYRKAKTVLTSNDPNYKEKLRKITKILSGLKKDEKFFSIDEFGPFAIKMIGGKSLVPAGTHKSVPQWQKSKGSLILTAALELSTNQVTHFYSEKKNTEEMIKLLHLLLKEYAEEKTIYFSWDAASWHASKELYKAVDKINTPEYRNRHISPVVKLAPLPTCAQFLNVIESVFSGMARAIIHNSDYQSVDKCKEAIDKYYKERNERFLKNPKKAGNKIWGKERVKAIFSESNNCKDPKYER